MFETAVVAHALVERILPGMPERRVAEIVREANRLGQRFVQTQRRSDGATDLCHLERVRDASAIQIAFVIDENLGFVDQSAKRVRVDDAVTIALEFATILGRWFGVASATTARIVRGPRREYRSVTGCDRVGRNAVGPQFAHEKRAASVAARASSGQSAVTKARPMPRIRMKRTRPA